MNAAGSTVKSAFQQAMKMNDGPCAILPAGELSCEKIIFIPWIPDQTTDTIFENSIRKFVVTAMYYAGEAGCLTLAFPALGKHMFVDSFQTKSSIL